MKKIVYISFIFIICSFFVYGCNMSNTPTKKVEEFLDCYRNLDEKVTNQMDDVIALDNLMSDDERLDYKDILRRQYQDLVYEIKNEVIDGDTSTVTVEIEVYDFYKVTNESSDYYNDNIDEFSDAEGNIISSKYIDYRLKLMKDTNERVKYTIPFTLSKIDNKWVVDNINDVTRQKIHGLYAY